MMNKLTVFKTIILTIGITLISAATLAEITISEDRTFITNSNTVLRIDDLEVTISEFNINSKSMFAEIEIDEDINADVTSGTAKLINAENQIKGPVTNLSPFQVLGQDVVIDGDTLMVNNNGAFTLGQLLKISGNFTKDNAILSTRIELVSDLDEYKLMSHITSVNNEIINFADLAIDTTGVSFKDCSTGPQTGELIELKAAVIVNFDINTILNTVTDFECKSGIIIIPPGNDSTTIQFSAEGFVTEIIDASHFMLNGQLVEHSLATVLINGTLDDLELGVKVEAEGDFDVANNSLVAQKLKFQQLRVRITAPALISELDSNQVTLLNITGLFSALTKDDDMLLPQLSQDSQIELRGYLDSSGQLMVDRIRERGTPDPTDIRLRGPVSNVSSPSFTILGVNIDTSTALFFIEDTSVDSNTFFASLVDGAQVDVNNGIYDAVTNTISGGEITLEDVAPTKSIENTNLKHSLTKAFGLGGIGKGKISIYIPDQGVAPVGIINTSNLTVTEGSQVTLDGSNSTGDTLSYVWTQTAGIAVQLSDATTASTTFTAPQVSEDTVLTFELIVTDNISRTNMTEVNISVKNTVLEPPMKNSGGGSMGFLLLFMMIISMSIKLHCTASIDSTTAGT